ncbi:MAG: tRNA pseudouridine(38-40) synthase TruA [Candidatus Krumholzibacteriota bacterium]|nr:tRNA pseudouridine(38-40) synthase TruA [Candidatus Krumholzibacteriota bacterium]
MRNFKLTIEYDGAGFAGWQVQPDERTVQGEILRALGPLARGAVDLVGAGRTDAGVHATGQVAHARMETRHDADTIRRALGGTLPPAILVKAVEEVPPGFHARYDARERSYEYLFITRPTALWRGRTYNAGGPLDVGAMRAALRPLIGEHDFASFAAAGCAARTTRCRVIRANVSTPGPLVVLELTADRFLHNMVRILAGTLLDAGRGKPVDTAAILDARDREAAGPTLPPRALYLVEVRY